MAMHEHETSQQIDFICAGFIQAARGRARAASSVIAGLDPAIHLLRMNLSKTMDTRVKPAYDDVHLTFPCRD
jgi:hypothetical protein